MPNRIKGTSVSTGLAIAPVHVVTSGADEIPTFTVGEGRIDAEIARLEEALASASAELDRRREIVASQAGPKEAEIFGVQKLVLQDPGALEQVQSAIREQRINAESAVKLLIDRLSQTLGKLGEDQSRGFVADVSEPWKRVLDALLNRDREAVLSVGEKVVVAAAELTPRTVTYFSREYLLGVICEVGGRYSHGAVLARALGIPCVVGVPNLLARLEQDMIVAVDGDRGFLQLSPSDEDEAEFEERLIGRQERASSMAELALSPAETSDGAKLTVKANIEGLRDLDTFDIATIDGVGLFRTEFLYMERNQFPSEEEQYRVYRRVLERLDGKPVTMRTLDIGADKKLPYFKTPHEPNPALGWRGLRIALGWSDLMRVQLRALMRASVHGNLRILLPMVTSLEEVREVHKLYDLLRKELVSQGYDVAEHVPVGAMIEVPSSFLTLRHLIKEVDFVSVGTNDLVQYLLAVDRDNPWVANLFEPYHPAVLMALKYVASTTREAGKSCGVCGDMAADPATAVMLLGMGFDSISAAAHFAPEIKHAVRSVTMEEAEELAKRLDEQAESQAVRGILEEFGERFDLTVDALRFGGKA
ncbi:MAG: phosphoenolpyruvate--protein phosphotransferase [Planctomycetota bacterium]|nr:phosphoenolpyruvate--protein phosphotransferase [Planctomycetota bacterium]